MRSIDPCAIRKTLGDRAAAGAHLQPVSMIGLEELANTIDPLAAMHARD
ncbi:hypothetical protein [Xanthomonas campestris]|nr:hypothetical protein [Xanthomonas campestris]MCC5067366.1 hypothetical protein [Xanthomonas campestris]MCC5084977.1 hypothetical protein [Xanthomonas campestris]WDI92599.1 hypothetical protein JH280_15060 [Xanthomonas campestris]